MMLELSPLLFSGSGLFYGLLLPVVAVGIFSLILIPAIHVAGAKPMNACKAIYCYTLQIIGIFMMSLAGFPAVYGVLAEVMYDDSDAYLALLLVFTAGGLIFLWHDAMARTIDTASRSVPQAIFTFTFRLVGVLAASLAILSLFLTMLLSDGSLDPFWWIQPMIFLFYGLILSWCTWDYKEKGGITPPKQMMAKTEKIILPPTKARKKK